MDDWLEQFRRLRKHPSTGERIEPVPAPKPSTDTGV